MATILRTYYIYNTFPNVIRFETNYHGEKKGRERSKWMFSCYPWPCGKHWLHKHQIIHLSCLYKDVPKTREKVNIGRVNIYMQKKQNKNFSLIIEEKTTAVPLLSHVDSCFA